MLLERERELTELGDALRAASEGGGRVILVEGDAGIGKTSLLQAASEIAGGQGFRCLRARASELERDFAFGCVRQLLESTIVRAADAVRERLFAGAAALSKRLFALSDASELSSAADTSFSMLHGLYWLLNNLADDAPVTLLVDDLHWADAESLKLIHYLAPRLDGCPLLLVASARRRKTSHVDVARLAAGPETTVLRPGPVSVDATAVLCEQRLGVVTRDFAAACWEATGGNPFFLDMLLREAADEKVPVDANGAARVRRMGPPAVAHAVLLRLSEAPAAAAALVRAVAVLGDGASLAEAAILADVAEDEAARAADLLVAHRVLLSGETLQFVHPIVREAVYADIGSRLRSEAHGRAASILAARGASDERVAAQIIEAEPGGDEARVELLRGVAAGALARGGPTAAVALLRRALVEPPPPPSTAAVLFDLGRAELRVAAPEALDHLTAAVQQWRGPAGQPVRQPDQLTRSVRLLANALTSAGQSDKAVDALASAIDIIEPVDRGLALFLEADLAAHAQEASIEARAPAAKRLERYAQLDGTTPAERLVLTSLAFERARASESERHAAAHLRQALAGGRLLDEQELDVSSPMYTLVVGLLATDDFEMTDTVLDRLLSGARASVSVPAMAFVLTHQGVASMRRGAVADAEADARTALELLVGNGIPLGVELALAVLVEALVEGGDREGAQQALDDNRLGIDVPPGMPSNPLLEARATLRLAQGRASDGLDDLIEFGRRDELWGGANPLASRWRSRASFALAALGDTQGARQMALDDLKRAQRWGASSGLGVALRASALVDGGTVSVDRLRTAVEVLASSVARLEHARALTDLGAALRRANQRREARRALQEGFHLAERCGAHALAARARTELRAAGGRSSALTGTGVQQLTASERRVAELAAEGRSNPEIAQMLFVTRKTVETHLGSVYRKLAISGRGRLARALAEPT